MNLTTTARVKDHIGIPSADTSRDAKIAAIVGGVSRYVEGQTSRRFGLSERSLVLSGDGTDELILPDYPVISISALSVDGTALTEEQIEDLDKDLEAGILYRTAGWREERRNIRITLEAGYLDPDDEESGGAVPLPEDLVLAATRLAARIYERSTAEGVASVSPSSFSVSYKDAMDEDIKETIARHSRVRIR